MSLADIAGSPHFLVDKAPPGEYTGGMTTTGNYPWPESYIVSRYEYDRETCTWEKHPRTLSHEDVPTEILAKIEEVASKGAAYLDKDRPKWYDTVKPKKLDMISCSSCVAGQVFADLTEQFGNGFDGLENLKAQEFIRESIDPDPETRSDEAWSEAGQWMQEHGFDVPYFPGTDDVQRFLYVVLEAAWDREIHARRGTDPSKLWKTPVLTSKSS